MKVNHAIWLVDDIDTVVKTWKQLDFQEMRLLEKSEIRIEDDVIEVTAIIANLGGCKVLWMQPLRGRSFLTDYLDKHGAGVMALIHSAETTRVIKEETDNLNKKRIKIQSEFRLKSSKQELNYTVMNTLEDGGFNIGFVLSKDSDKLFENLPADNNQELSFNHYVFNTDNFKEVSKFWNRIGGLPKISENPVLSTGKNSNGETDNLQVNRGWQKLDEVLYIWSIVEFLKNKDKKTCNPNFQGGVKCLGFKMDDADKRLKYYRENGFNVKRSEKYTKTEGIYSDYHTYIISKKTGGLEIELLTRY